MSFHSVKSREDRERERLPHPIWRGVGFAMIVVVPIISFVISDELVQYWQNNVPGFSFPANLRQTLEIPVYGDVEGFWGVVILAALITLAFFAIFSFINAIVYRTTREKNLRVFESRPQKYERKKKLKKPKDQYKKKDSLF
jgi:hypothetical protein